MSKKPQAIELLLDGARGQYIPRDFALECAGYPDNINERWDVADGDLKILAAGPDDELYWEAWDSVLDNARFNWEGKQWVLFLGEGGDLFAYCYEEMTVRQRFEWREVLGLDPEGVFKPSGTISDAETIDELMTAFNFPPERWRQYNSGPESFWVELLDAEGKMVWRAPTFQPDFMFEFFRAVQFEQYRMGRGF